MFQQAGNDYGRTMVIDVSLTDGVKIGLDHHEARSKTMHQASVTGFETLPP
jgi:hypothetical protein